MKKRGVIITVAAYLVFVAVVSVGQITQVPGGSGGGAGPPGPPGPTGPSGPQGPAGPGGGGTVTQEGGNPMANNCAAVGAGTTNLRTVCGVTIDGTGNMTANTLSIGDGTQPGEVLIGEPRNTGDDHWSFLGLSSYGQKVRLSLPNVSPTGNQVMVIGATTGANVYPVTLQPYGASNVINCGLFSTAQADTLSTDGATYSTYTSTNVGNAETAFAKNCVIPANTFVPGVRVEFRAIMAATLSTGSPNMTYNVRIGSQTGTLVLTGGALDMPDNQTYRAYPLSWACWGTAAAGAAVTVACVADGSGQGTTGGGQVMGWGSIINTTAAFQSTVATNGSLTFVVTAQFTTATAGNMVQMLALRATIQ